MAPFKANGREIQPQSPDEVIRLMQQGANYVKKMTALKPNLKLMRMLQNHDLLDENKLAFLIDLNRKDTSAIQKLLKDAKVDPIDLDTSEEPNYRPGNHTVSDDEMTFHDVLGDVVSTPTGKETVQLIHDTWDAKSKEAVFQEPEIMRVIDGHRASGVYDRISAEIDRRRTVGTLSTNAPFVEAYKIVGDDLHAQGRLFPQAEQGQPTPAPAAPAPVAQPTRRVVGSRPAATRTTASNGDRAKAASPARSTPHTSQAKKVFDPLNMSDEEIMAVTSPKY
jgi:hypothetical protein